MGKLICLCACRVENNVFFYNFVLEYSNNVFQFVTGQDAVTVQLYLSP